MTIGGWVAVIILFWFTAAVISAIAGKVLKKNREMMEVEAIERCREAITRFLNDEADDDEILVGRDRRSGKVKSEEALNLPDPCVICLEYGGGDDEDIRPKLISIRGRYVPLCAQHKRFITQCLDDKISLDDGPDPLSL